jgi:dTMP kinase
MVSEVQKGIYFGVEGGEGTGKGSVLRIINKRLGDLGIQVELVREPGGTELGETIREFLLHKDDVEWDTTSEVLAFNLARRLLFKKIGRLVANGLWVSSDRTYLSTLAYQGHGREHIDMARAITDHTIEGYEPDILMVIDTDVKTALSRQLVNDRIGGEDITFHSRVAEGYLIEAKERGLIIINGNVPLEEVVDQAWENIKPFIKEAV